MGSMYRILIEGGDGETVADLTAPVEMLAQFAPEAVARLLREATPETNEQGVSAALADTASEQSRQRRPRRTKAQMEADRLAAEQSSALASMTDDGSVPGPAPMAMDGPAEVAAYNPFGPK